MATFVLVHGAWHGGWCWKRVRRILQAQGHDVFTPTLTGVGDRAHLASRAVNLETHVSDVANLILWEELEHVVLCGHSYAGCVITGVADRVLERLGALVYLDAFVLEDGESLYATLPPPVRDAQREGLQAYGDGFSVPPIPAAVFDVNAADRDWVDRLCTPHPVGAFEQPVRARRTLPVERITHVLATGYEHSPFGPYHERAKRRGWRTATIDSGHDAMLDRPDETAELLLAAARS